MGQWQRRVVVGLCGAVIASLLVGAVGALRSDAGRVVRRPWPSRVAATGPWAATMQGEGDRLVLTAPGVVQDGLDGAVVDVRSAFPGASSAIGRPKAAPELQLPDGSRWVPRRPFRLEGVGDVPFFVDDPPVLRGGGPFRSLTAHGSSVRVPATSLEVALATARSPVVAVGTFRRFDGATVKRLTLPAGTEVTDGCPQQTRIDQRAPCPTALTTGRVAVTLPAGDGLTIRATGRGEAALAGTVSAEALGRSWTGLVGALEATELAATAVRRAGRWELTASGQGASQLWVDVWPVVDTVLAVTSAPAESSFLSNLFGGYDVNTSIDIRNVGFATSQIYESVGRVPLRPTASQGHDAGLGVRRPSRARRGTVGGGSLSPGATSEEELQVRGYAAITLRGNFPDVSVALVT